MKAVLQSVLLELPVSLEKKSQVSEVVITIALLQPILGEKLVPNLSGGYWLVQLVSQVVLY